MFCLSNTDAQTSAKARDSLKTLIKNERRDASRVLLLIDLGNTYRTNKPDKAMHLALDALSISQRISFTKGEAISLNLIGEIYRIEGNSAKAMTAYLESLKLNEKINNQAGIASNFNNMGLIYRVQEQYSLAIEYFKKAQEIYEQIGNKSSTASWTRLARTYFATKQYDSATVYSQQAYQVARKLNNSFPIGAHFSLMGDIYNETGEKKLALEYYRQSLPYLRRSEVNDVLSTALLSMAKLFESGRQKDSSLFYANQAFEINKAAKYTKGVSDASTFLSSFHENTGNSDSALFYIKVAAVAKDSLFSEQRSNQFQSLIYDEKVRQKEIAIDRQHNLQFTALAIGLITFIILFFVLSRSIIVKTQFIEFFGILGLLAVFEFINLFIHPHVAHLTNDSPVLMLLILIVIGALLVPLHHKLEKWITKIMVEKNKRIRLEAARKTIAELKVQEAT
jgi:tetratricopeptide (TPR) repeat protein